MSGTDETSYDVLPRWMQIIVGSVCVLSILGSLAIVLTYALVKDIRSKARELLVHISLMDITYTTANFVGLSIPYHKHLYTKGQGNDTEILYHEIYWPICRAQAFFSVYGTVSSVLWTLALAVYLYYRIVARDATVTKRLVKVLYVVCYALPLYVSLWLLLDHHVGYSYYATSGAGWCFVNDHIKGVEIFMIYDIWLWLGVIILIPLYLTIYVHTRHELKRLKIHYLMTREQNTHPNKAERKLLLVPVGFILLRIWDIVDDFFIVYKHHHLNDNRRNWLKLINAIGDCGQGSVNFVIFFVFQPRLRAMAVNVICCCCCYCCKKSRDHQRPSFLIEEEDDDEVEENNKVMRDPGDVTFSQHTPR